MVISFFHFAWFLLLFTRVTRQFTTSHQEVLRTRNTIIMTFCNSLVELQIELFIESDEYSQSIKVGHIRPVIQHDYDNN